MWNRIPPYAPLREHSRSVFPCRWCFGTELFLTEGALRSLDMHGIKKCYPRNLKEWLLGRPFNDPEGIAVCGFLHLDVLNGPFELLSVCFWSFFVEAVSNRSVCGCQDLSISTISETVTPVKHRCNIFQHHARRKDRKAIVVHVFPPWFQYWNTFLLRTCWL